MLSYHPDTITLEWPLGGVITTSHYHNQHHLHHLHHLDHTHWSPFSNVSAGKAWLSWSWYTDNAGHDNDDDDEEESSQFAVGVGWSHFQTQPLLKSEPTPPLLLVRIHHRRNRNRNHLPLHQLLTPTMTTMPKQIEGSGLTQWCPQLSVMGLDGDLMASTDNQFATTPPFSLCCQW